MDGEYPFREEERRADLCGTLDWHPAGQGSWVRSGRE